MSDREYLGDVFYDRIIGGNHRHRDDHEQGRFYVVEFHAAESISTNPVAVENPANEVIPGRSLRSSTSVSDPAGLPGGNRGVQRG